MFSNYFNNKIIYRLSKNDLDLYVLMELNLRRNEAYYFVPKNNSYEIYLRDLNKKELEDDRIVSIDDFFNEYGLDKDDFKSSIKRTNKLVQSINHVNKLNKEAKTKTYKK